MKILLINPNDAKKNERDYFTTVVMTPLMKCDSSINGTLTFPLALTTLAAVTPAEHEVKIVDEVVESINFEEECDFIGITALTAKIDRAYQIAEEFKQRGKPVVLGGIHATMCTEEVEAQFDCVAIGEVEEIWPILLKDFENNKLKKKYKALCIPDITRIPPPRYDLIRQNYYSMICVQTSRGCPHDCFFCAVTKMNGRTMRFKIPEQVVKEIDYAIQSLSNPPLPVKDKRNNMMGNYRTSFFITDDNFTANRDHAISVCQAMVDYQKKTGNFFTWGGQVDFRLGLDKELIGILSRAGCDYVLIGFESLELNNLQSLNKQMNPPDQYSEVIQNLREQGITCIPSMIIGNEFDTSETADEMLKFINENNIFSFSLSILTPFPGTNLYQEFEDKGQLIENKYSDYNFRNPVFTHQRLTYSEILKMYSYLCKKIFSLKETMLRLNRNRKQDQTIGRFVLTKPYSFIVCVRYIGAFLGLAFRKKVSFSSIIRIVPQLLVRVFWGGDLSELIIFGWVLDYDHFAKCEIRRIEKILKKERL